MTVLVPHTRLHPATALLLALHAPGAVRVHLDPHDVAGYWRLLEERWAAPGDLVLVGQDIGIRAGVLGRFAECREPWCGHAYPDGSEVVVTFGCSRFTGELKARCPDLIRVAELAGPVPEWRAVDALVGRELHRRGVSPHTHPGAVTHFHRSP